MDSIYKNLWLKRSLGEQHSNVTVNIAKSVLSIVHTALPEEPFHDLRVVHFIFDTAIAAVEEEEENIVSRS